MVGNDVSLRNQLIASFHDGVVGGHSGVLVITKRLVQFSIGKVYKEWSNNMLRSLMFVKGKSLN